MISSYWVLYFMGKQQSVAIVTATSKERHTKRSILVRRTRGDTLLDGVQERSGERGLRGGGEMYRYQRVVGRLMV